jgi:hypothetical protein
MASFASLIQRGTRSGQAAASSVPIGTLYYVTDEYVIERSTGSAWEVYAIKRKAYNAGNSSTAITLDWSNGLTQLLTLTGNCTVTLSNPQDGFTHVLALKQDGTGSRTVTWPSAVKWSGGSAPTLTTTAAHCDLIKLTWYAGLGASGNYLGEFVLNYTPA